MLCVLVARGWRWLCARGGGVARTQFFVVTTAIQET